MGLLNDIYDTADHAKSAKEEKAKKESMRKALAKKKTAEAAKRKDQDNFGLF